MKAERIPGYRKTGKINGKALSLLIQDAMNGSDVAAFASLIGVNHKALNDIIVRFRPISLSYTCLLSIARNATLESGVTIDKLLKASGYEEDGSEKTKENITLGEKKYIEALRVIQESIESLQHNVSSFACRRFIVENETDVYSHAGITKVVYDINFAEGSTLKKETTHILNAQLNRRNCSDEELYTVVVADGTVFSELAEEYLDAIAPGPMSVMLIDLEEGIVLKEYVLICPLKQIESVFSKE